MVTVRTLLYPTCMRGFVSMRSQKHQTYGETLVHSYVRSILRL